MREPLFLIHVSDESPLYGGEANHPTQLARIEARCTPDACEKIAQALRSVYPARTTRIVIEEIEEVRRVTNRFQSGGVGPNTNHGEIRLSSPDL